MNTKIRYILFGMLFLTFITPSLAWYYTGWDYRKPINITENSGNTLRDYQVFINLTYDPNMQSDFSDIRFTWLNSTDNTEVEIPYWIQNYVSGQYAEIWIKVPEIPASSSTIVYVYYGNTTPVTTTSDPSVCHKGIVNGHCTDMGDDFNDNSIATNWVDVGSDDIWYEGTGTEGNITWQGAGADFIYFPLIYTGYPIDLSINATIIYRNMNPVLGTASYGNYRYAGLGFWDPVQKRYLSIVMADDQPTFCGVAGNFTYEKAYSNVHPIITNRWYNFTAQIWKYNATFVQIDIYNETGDIICSVRADMVGIKVEVGLGNRDGGAPNPNEEDDQSWDYIYAWDWVDPEPTYVVGSEELANIPPEINLFLVAETKTLDLTADGTNYGATSEGWTPGETVSKTLDAPSTTRNQYLLIRRTNTDGSLTIDVNGFNIGTSSAGAPGDTTYKIDIFEIPSSYLSSNPQTITISAPSTNPETVYIDWIKIVDTVNASLIAESSDLTIILNATDVDNGLTEVWSEVNSVNITLETFRNTFNYGNYTGFYTAPISDTFLNFLGKASDGIGITQTGTTTVEVDATPPSINSITISDVNLELNQQTNIESNVTDKHLSSVTFKIYPPSGITSEVTPSNVTDIYYYNLTVDEINDWKIEVIAQDLVGHITRLNSTTIHVSQIITQNQSITQNETYVRPGFSVTDLPQYVDVWFYAVITINASGTAYIDDHKYQFFIPDINYQNVTIYNSTGGIIPHTDYGNGTIEWTIEPVNGSVDLTEKIIWRIANALEFEWENTGTESVRLFRMLTHNVSESHHIYDIWVAIPVRTWYDPGNYKVDFRVCTDIADISLWTCNLWSVVDIYDPTQTNYHGGVYPTEDWDNDTLKDTLILKVPQLSAVLWRIDVVTGAEPSWVSEPESSGTLSSGPTGIPEEPEEEELTSVETCDFFCKLKNFIFVSLPNMIRSIFMSFTSAIKDIKVSLPEGTMIYVLGTITIIGAIILLRSYAK